MGEKYAHVRKNGALDRIVFVVDTLFDHAAMLSELKNGDLFYQHNGLPRYNLSKAVGDAYICENELGDKLWAVKFEYIPPQKKKKR